LIPEERKRYDSIGKPGKKIPTYNYEETTVTNNERKDYREMRGDKIPVPSKEWILEQCKKYQAKTKAVYGIAKERGVSAPVVFGWFKELEIDYKFKFGKPDPEEPINKTEPEKLPEDEAFEYAEAVETKFITDMVKPEDFVLINKTYKFGEYSIDVQYDHKEVIIVDNVNLVEISLPFAKVKRFAGNLFGIGVELMGKEEKE
jgi:hypothetical protein